jgi:uroporphyrinogen decarboxylase
MNGRTRVHNAISRQPIDRIPRCDALWEDTLIDWRKQGFPEDAEPAEYFDWDIVDLFMDASMRRPAEIIESDGDFIVYRDAAGYTVRKFRGESRSLAFLDHATKDRHTWEELKTGFRFDPEAPARIDVKSYFMHMDDYPSWEHAKTLYDVLRDSGKYIRMTVYGPWEATWRHRGYEQLFMDLALDPDWVLEMAETQVSLVETCLRHCLSLGIRPDALFLVEDLAGQTGPLFSPEMWRALFKPLMKRMGNWLRRNGISFWMHSCGNCEVYLEDFIECGLDVIQPLQASAGFDVRDLKRRLGDQLTFFGNIDVRKMSGSEAECNAEIRDKITVAKENGGYIYHSDHSVPPEVTFGRYRQVMEWVETYGAY